MTIQNRRSGLAALSVCALLVAGACEARAQSRADSDLDKKLASPFATFRLGIMASPALGVDGGLDVTFPRFSIARDWVSRIDVVLSARTRSRSFGSRRDGEVFPTFCQVYTPGGVNRGRTYLGAGVGPIFGPHSDLGAKVFAGVNLTPVCSLEFEARFPGDGSTRAIAMVRLAAL